MNVFRRQEPRDTSRVPIMVMDEAERIEFPVPSAHAHDVSPQTPTNKGQDRTKKNRKIINSFLRHVGKMTGFKDLSLNKQKGTCFFQFKQFVIIIEVPEGSSSFIIYAMVYSMNTNDDRFAIAKTCRQWSNTKHATKGSTLGLDGDEVTLFYSLGINGTSREIFVQSLEQFMSAAVEVNRKLELLRG